MTQNTSKAYPCINRNTSQPPKLYAHICADVQAIRQCRFPPILMLCTGLVSQQISISSQNWGKIRKNRSKYHMSINVSHPNFMPTYALTFKLSGNASFQPFPWGPLEIFASKYRVLAQNTTFLSTVPASDQIDS